MLSTMAMDDFDRARQGGFGSPLAQQGEKIP
jgi:hypothetical protein